MSQPASRTSVSVHCVVSTLQAVGLLILTIVPGAVLTFSYERHAGPLAGHPNERSLRFLIGTAIVFPFTATLALWTFARVLHVPVGEPPREYRNRLADPSDVSLWWTFVPLAYVLIPWLLGRLGGSTRLALRRRTVASGTSSLAPGLAAWDVVFLDPGPKLISIKLRNGPWVAGIFAASSFASAPAAKEKELLLERQVGVDDSGQIQRDESGIPLQGSGAVVVHYSDVELMIVERT